MLRPVKRKSVNVHFPVEGHILRETMKLKPCRSLSLPLLHKERKRVGTISCQEKSHELNFPHISAVYITISLSNVVFPGVLSSLTSPTMLLWTIPLPPFIYVWAKADGQKVIVCSCLFLAIQLYLNFKFYYLYFFPKSVLPNWWCGLFKDAACAWTLTVCFVSQ